MPVESLESEVQDGQPAQPGLGTLLSELSLEPPQEQVSSITIQAAQSSPKTSPSPQPTRAEPKKPGTSDNGEGNHRCEECQESFNDVEEFNHHRRYHGKSPYECPYPACAGQFIARPDLDRHIGDRHLNPKLFYCRESDDCAWVKAGEPFDRKDDLKSHLIEKHGYSEDAATRSIPEIPPDSPTILELPPTLTREDEAHYAEMIDEILSTANLEIVSRKMVRVSLEAKLGEDLTEIKDFISALTIQRFDRLRTMPASSVVKPPDI